MRNRVVITGLGVVCGLGKDVPEFWQNIVDCKSGIAPIESIDMSGLRFKNGCEVKNYDPTQHFSKKELDLMDKFSQFALIAAKEAVKDAAIEWTDELKKRTCVITGTCIGGQDAMEETFTMLFKENKERAPLFTIPRVMPNAGASHITMEYGITGIAYAVSTACSSSNHAIGNAFWLVRNGLCDMAITGGSEVTLSYGYLKAWEAIRVVAPDTCRPFSKTRQGMVLGEGGAMLVLESLESATKRGAKIYGEVVGFGMSSDASHITKPNQLGAETAMQMAMEDAEISPEKIDYINAHGTGTMVNDAMETAAIKNVFGEHSKKLAVSATKSLHGHVLGGTSAIEAVATTLALKHQVFPPTANFEERDEECDLDVVPNKSRQGVINYALSNSFAFGGLNAVLAFKKWDRN
ncbi:MAG TPA: beta-ketoacyl-[acyl-carrier-protein] synthase family protein [Flavisolibacter sp.]|jgi:nodulation protein E|nr:beta-ketoacyl-[acyl-carrier-protein] synthase family protein [Flavisolibacter sp.]